MVGFKVGSKDLPVTNVLSYFARSVGDGEEKVLWNCDQVTWQVQPLDDVIGGVNLQTNDFAPFFWRCTNFASTVISPRWH